MTEAVTVMRCALCRKPFSYVPTPEDKCAPGTPNQICDTCAEHMIAEAKRDEEMHAWYYSQQQDSA